MKKLLLLSALLIFAFGFGQTPITDANFNQAIQTCLSTNPIDGMCSDSEYGAMPDWDVSQVTDMSDAFFQRTDLNADLSTWDVSNVSDMSSMFNNASSFNQPIGNWDMSGVTEMNGMFYNAASFNQDISNWCVTNITSEPSDFSDFSPLTESNKPIWGTCTSSLYEWINYGTQDWTVENAEMVTYRDGTPIPQVTDATEWANLTTGAWCYYDNDPTKGKLYNWYAVMGIHDNDANTPNKELAPEGWHVPSDEEWTTLENHLIANGYNYDGTTTGNKIAKAMASTTGWNSSENGGAVGNDQTLNNSSGFNAVPGGSILVDVFSGYGSQARFWTSTYFGSDRLVHKRMDSRFSNISSHNEAATLASSIRFVRDATSLSTYEWINYGTQDWTVENAEMVTYRDGTPIPQVTDATEWANLTTGAWCYYDNDPTKGKLYNWYAVAGIHDNDPNTPNKELAPEGWHVPSVGEWSTLGNYLITNGYNFDGTTTGNKIAKSMSSTAGWAGSTIEGSPGNNQLENNSSGFNSLPVGYGGGDYFEGYDSMSFFWTSEFFHSDAALYKFLKNFQEALNGSATSCKTGMSVRFVRDATSLSTTDFSNSIIMYPNPVKNTLTIDGLVVKDVVIYSVLGKAVLNISNQNTIDVSSLSKGVYFIKVSDGINASTKKFIKEQ